VEIRPVKPHEYAEAGQVVVAAYRALPGAHMSGSYADELADIAGRVAASEVLVAVDQRLIGCVTLVPDPQSPWAEGLRDDEVGIRMLAVLPDAQGRGVGESLVQAGIARARKLGRKAIFLHSTPWMTGAHRLYQRAGFVRLPERDWQPVPDVPLLAFRLQLD
jgi:ribosomal protein S18 acetylase RimI-like enzyme